MTDDRKADISEQVARDTARQVWEMGRKGIIENLLSDRVDDVVSVAHLAAWLLEHDGRFLEDDD